MGVIIRNNEFYGAVNLRTIADDYSSSSTYVLNSYVIHGGDLYRCISAIETAEVWTPAHWTKEPLSRRVTEWLNTPTIDNVGY